MSSASLKNQGNELTSQYTTNVSLYIEEFIEILEKKRLTMHYQPIVNLSEGTSLGYEGLTRGPKESFFHSPLHLFNFAEKQGKLYSLEKITRDLAIETSKGWLKSNEKLFINLNSNVLYDPNFTPGYTKSLLKRCMLSPENIVFEITERFAIQDFKAFKTVLNHYRNQGFQIAIDDAGAGYSSLQAIAELEPEYIKIDRSLVRDIDQSDVKKAVLEAFLMLSSKINSNIIAEGIETIKELETLISIGVEYGQGYVLAKPSYPVSPTSPLSLECIKKTDN